MSDTKLDVDTDLGPGFAVVLDDGTRMDSVFSYSPSTSPSTAAEAQVSPDQEDTQELPVVKAPVPDTKNWALSELNPSLSSGGSAGRVAEVSAVSTAAFSLISLAFVLTVAVSVAVRHM